MTVPIASYELRVREVGAPDTAWQYRSQVAGQVFVVRELQRGTPYELQMRSIGVNGRASDWVDVEVNVPDTNRVGAAALPNIGNQQSMWDMTTSVTFAASSDAEGASVATISVTAGTLVIGSVQVAYAASSASLTGAAGQKVTVYLYYYDPQLQGGSRQLRVTTNIVETANTNGNVAITALQITFPPAGSSGSGGGSIGGGGGSGGAKNPAFEEQPI
ncbi:hypothetical protein N5J29_09330 [Stenotrophomonas sp. GD03680]|uniref:hypothetical protein n=1 Tax=Stenotrophomonas sp. GD03680 TaxID=2975365 RepID=UPI00244C8618|nr:hypothetical protein [Stenotrophomonas sp. GD03680]MDH2022958.1 hypothetical protein [Stenotrophomonas sp. GD03680]